MAGDREFPAVPFRAPLFDELRKVGSDWANWFRSVKALLDRVHTGSGSPEGVVPAPIGHLYLRSDGSTSTTLYVKTADTGLSTGWTAK